MVSAWGSSDRVPMCCHLPRVLSKPGDPGAFVGSRSVGGTGALTLGTYRYLYPANPAPAAITAAMTSHATRDRVRRLVRPPRRRTGGAVSPVASAAAGGPRKSVSSWTANPSAGVCQGLNDPVGASAWSRAGGKPRAGVRPGEPGEPGEP